MAPLRIGVLGAAAIAPGALVKPARRVPRAEVVAVAARDRARAQAFATKWSIPEVLDSYDDVVAHPDVDAVYIPLPNSRHAEWIERSLEAGKHVLCEKPLTSNADQARRVAAAADRSAPVLRSRADRRGDPASTGTLLGAAEENVRRDPAHSTPVLMEAFHYRYHPLMHRAVEVVQSGELGELRSLESWMQVPLFKRQDIRFERSLAGGAVMDLGCYSIHQLRSLAGDEPTVTSAVARERTPDVDRWMRADLRFPSGATGRFTVSLYGAVPLRVGFRVIGTEGELRVLNPAGPQIFHRFVVRTEQSRRRETFRRRPTYEYQLEAFCDAVLEGAPILTGPEDSIATMSVIDDVYRAAGLRVRD